jgi:hypothetical protein
MKMLKFRRKPERRPDASEWCKSIMALRPYIVNNADGLARIPGFV